MAGNTKVFIVRYRVTGDVIQAVLSLRFKPEKNAAAASSTVLTTPLLPGVGLALVVITLGRLGRPLEVEDFLAEGLRPGTGFFRVFLLTLGVLAAAGAGTSTAAEACGEHVGIVVRSEIAKRSPGPKYNVWQTKILY